MVSYEAPAVIELGSVADFTQQDQWDWDYDGKHFRGDVTS